MCFSSGCQVCCRVVLVACYSVIFIVCFTKTTKSTWCMFKLLKILPYHTNIIKLNYDLRIKIGSNIYNS